MIQNDEIKTCKVCNEGKERAEFYTKGARSDSRCKSCVLRQKSKIYSAKKKLSPKRKTSTCVSGFTVTFIGHPDMALFAYRIRSAIGEMENDE